MLTSSELSVFIRKYLQPVSERNSCNMSIKMLDASIFRSYPDHVFSLLHYQVLDVLKKGLSKCGSESPRAWRDKLDGRNRLLGSLSPLGIDAKNSGLIQHATLCTSAQAVSSSMASSGFDQNGRQIDLTWLVRYSASFWSST